MPEREQRARMRLMRGLVAEFNVFRWAGRMLIDAAGMRKRRRLHGSADHPGCSIRNGGRRRSERMTLPVTGFAYFLDIDGTLVDLADTPWAVKLHPALPDLVEALYQVFRWALLRLSRDVRSPMRIGCSRNDACRLLVSTVTSEGRRAASSPGIAFHHALWIPAGTSAHGGRTASGVCCSKTRG